MTAELFDLNDKTALITGGSRGLGLAVAKGLARYGANVAIIGRDRSQLDKAERQIQGSVWTFSYDLHDVDGIESMFADVVNTAGNIDILVNCAGIIRRAAAEDIDFRAWNEVMQVNLTATLATSQAFCRHRKTLGSGGKIVNFASLMCHGARPTTAAYAASKGGVLMLTKSLAVEWAKFGITVNAIGPGYFATEMTQPLRDDPKLNEWVLSRTPMGRWGTGDDLIGTTVFLASSASDFVTGQIIYVDGGWLAAL